eukprot:533246_1
MAPTIRNMCIITIILTVVTMISLLLLSTTSVNIETVANRPTSINIETVQLKYYLPDSIKVYNKQYAFNMSKIKQYCNVSYYKSYGRMYNCSNPSKSNKIKIGIVSAQLLFENALWNEHNDFHLKSSLTYRMALNNHIGYTIKHKYIYFEIRNLIESNLNGNYLKGKHIIIGQKPFIMTQIFKDFNESIDYLLYIDSDVLFYGCSYSIESQLINRAYNIYGTKHKYDFIWDRNLNAGIMLFKNSVWSNTFLSKEKYILKHAEKFNFYGAPPSYSGDQKCVWALISGFDPYNDNKHKFVKHLKWFVDIFQIDYIINVTNITFNQMILDEYNNDVMNWYKKYIIYDEFSNNIALIPSFYMNFASQWFYNPNYTHKIDSDPFMIHFTGGPRNKGLFHKEPFIYLNCFVPLT